MKTKIPKISLCNLSICKDFMQHLEGMEISLLLLSLLNMCNMKVDHILVTYNWLGNVIFSLEAEIFYITWVSSEH